MAILPVRFTAAQLQAYFLPQCPPCVGLDARDEGGQTNPAASDECSQACSYLGTEAASALSARH